MTAINLYREQLWRAWRATPEPRISEIPPNKAQLLSRASEFEKDRTWGWIHTGQHTLTWRAVRDDATGHVIQCVSDRSHSELTSDLRFGLRLMGWMSRRPVTWYWWDQPWERHLPANTDPGPEHLNGGWAVPGVLEVHVYRREEAHKVLLHELCHALDLDVPTAAIDGIRPEFERDLGRQLWPHLGEAFTELYAEWLWTIVRATTLHESRTLWAEQCQYSERQAALVWARIYDAVEPERTNVFAYYILKWVLMCHLDEVLLNPDRTVKHWFSWWRQAIPMLRKLTALVQYSEGHPMSMRMTL